MNAVSFRTAPLCLLIGWYCLCASPTPVHAAEAASTPAPQATAAATAPVPQADLAAIVTAADAAFSRNDFANAAQGYLQAAARGDLKAQTRLGILFEAGWGVPVNLVEAAKWYATAAQQDYAPAQASLGFLYEQGHGVPKNDTMAIKWYQKAAHNGNARGQNNLGVMYLRGMGVKADMGEAKRWFELSAAQGLQLAADNLRSVQALLDSIPAPAVSPKAKPAAKKTETKAKAPEAPEAPKTPEVVTPTPKTEATPETPPVAPAPPAVPAVSAQQAEVPAAPAPITTSPIAIVPVTPVTPSPAPVAAPTTPKPVTPPADAASQPTPAPETTPQATPETAPGAKAMPVADAQGVATPDPKITTPPPAVTPAASAVPEKAPATPDAAPVATAPASISPATTPDVEAVRQALAALFMGTPRTIPAESALTAQPSPGTPPDVLAPAVQTASAAPLFNMPLADLTRQDMEKSAQQLGLPPVGTPPAQCVDYVPGNRLPTASLMRVCYDTPKTGAGTPPVTPTAHQVQSVRFTFPVHERDLMQVVRIRDVVQPLYGQPTLIRGDRRNGPVRYEWTSPETLPDVQVAVTREWPDTTAYLTYTPVRAPLLPGRTARNPQPKAQTPPPAQPAAPVTTPATEKVAAPPVGKTPAAPITQPPAPTRAEGAKKANPNSSPATPLQGTDQEVRLFDVALPAATRTTMRQAIATWQVPLLSSGTDEPCDRYAAESLLPGSPELTVCYGTDNRLIHLSYALPVKLPPSADAPETNPETAADTTRSIRGNIKSAPDTRLTLHAMRQQLEDKYGPPDAPTGLTPGAADVQTWNRGKTRITLLPEGSDHTAQLRYSVPDNEPRPRGRGEVL